MKFISEEIIDRVAEEIGGMIVSRYSVDEEQ